MRPLLNVVDESGSHPLLLLVVEHCAGASLEPVAALCCTCRPISLTVRRWLCAQAHVTLSLGNVPSTALRRLGALACRLHGLTEIYLLTKPPTIAADMVAAHVNCIREAGKAPLPFCESVQTAVLQAMWTLEGVQMSPSLLASSGAGRAVKELKKHLRRVDEGFSQSTSRLASMLATRTQLVLVQWKMVARVPGACAGLELAPLRAVAARGGLLQLPDVLAGVASDEARFALTLLSARFVTRLAPGASAFNLGNQHRWSAPGRGSGARGLPDLYLGNADGVGHADSVLIQRHAATLGSCRPGSSQMPLLAGLLASGALENLRKLNLSGNHLNEGAFLWLARAVSSGALHRLTAINLSSNSLGDHGLSAIARALQRTGSAEYVPCRTWSASSTSTSTSTSSTSSTRLVTSTFGRHRADLYHRAAPSHGRATGGSMTKLGHAAGGATSTAALAALETLSLGYNPFGPTIAS